MPYRTAPPRGACLADAPPVRWWQWRRRWRGVVLSLRVRLRRHRAAVAEVARENLVTTTVTTSEHVLVRASCTVRGDGSLVQQKRESVVVRRTRQR